MVINDAYNGTPLSAPGTASTNSASPQIQDFSIDTSGSPADVARRQAMAQLLLRQGMDSTPAAGGKFGGLATIANRGMAAALGAWQNGQATEEEQQGRANHRQMLAAMLQSPDGKISPQAMIAAASDPWGTAAESTAVSHVADMQAQQARQAVEDKHWAATNALAQHADERATEAAKRADMTPLQQAQERAPVLQQYGIDPNSPEGKSYLVTGKMPDPNKDVPNSVGEYQYYIKSFKPTPEQPAPMDYGTFSTAKARAGATTIANNFDPNGAQTYDHLLTEGIAKSHAALANGVEDAQSRARDLAAMQGAVDAIQKGGGATGGMGQAQLQELKKTVNAAASSFGVNAPFDEKDISDREFLTKFNRQIAGAQAKGAVGSRVTNFELSNYLKANPGLEMSTTGNQRLIGIQSQIEQRNIAVGNQIRAAAADAIGQDKKINPKAIQKIITDYDAAHHIKDPVSGQDITQNYVLPEFQNQPASSNAALSADHSANMTKIRTWHPDQGVQ